MFPALALFVAIAAIAAIAYWHFQAEQKRRTALKQLAAAKGWTYRPYDPSLTSRWVGPPFGRGFDRQAANVIRGTVSGRDVLAFDYRYKERDTDAEGRTTTTTYRHAVCAVALPTIVPALHVSKENILTRIGGLVGFDDIELESDDFNRRFRVAGTDRKFACDVLHPRTMELLLHSPVEFRTELADIISWRDGRLVPTDVLARTSVLARVVDGIPAFVWKDQGYDPAAARAEGG